MRRTRLRTTGYIVVGALVVAVHLGLGGAAMEASAWTGWAANIVLAAVLVKIIAFGYFAARRMRGRRAAVRHEAPHDLEKQLAVDGAGAPLGKRDGSAPHLRRAGLATHAAFAAGHLKAAAGSTQGRSRRNSGNEKPMTRSEARIPTPRGERYAKQLCSHAARMTPRAEWNPPEGVIEFPDAMGTCRLTAEPEHLLLVLEATDTANLARMQQIIGSDIERFAGREGLKAEWVPV
ncbi:DUF2218 domain-containing protein [Streptomyces beijiangensis]|uniref:DUF2218 domain-containing protein n=1 Tax=Streptomyces beijiangensis TaxID=163361 RepID=A0A939FAW8_9ACTN|nr:DUF2218 domain-containing protein [Streptomyces beijiangensis]MBO0515650.1 DUF2218 domain-containing protein [Streptomyces beijiangensis]